MSDIYTLPALVESYGLTIEQWFDPKWNFMDPWKLKYFYRGVRVNLIRGRKTLPDRFEVSHVKNQQNRPMVWEHKWEQLTVSEENLIEWMNTYGAAAKRWSPVNTFGQGVISTYAAEFSMTGPRRLLYHIQNTRNEIAAAEGKSEEILKEADTTVMEKVGMFLSAAVRLMR